MATATQEEAGVAGYGKDSLDYPESTNAQKRKTRSPSPEENPKRTRLDSQRRDSNTDSAPSIRRDDHSPEESRSNVSTERRDRERAGAKPSSTATYDDALRRKNTTQEEKKRGMRLFGGLLGTLSQASGTIQQKKRLEKGLEIEKRQQEKERQRRFDDNKKMEDRLARLTEIRKDEQIKFDEQVVRSLLAGVYRCY